MYHHWKGNRHIATTNRGLVGELKGSIGSNRGRHVVTRIITSIIRTTIILTATRIIINGFHMISLLSNFMVIIIVLAVVDVDVVVIATVIIIIATMD